MTSADRIIRWSTAVAVVGVAAVAAVASYEHAYELVRAHGEAGWTARLVQLTVDGLIYASSMVMLDSARRRTPVPALARWLLGLGIFAGNLRRTECAIRAQLHLGQPRRSGRETTSPRELQGRWKVPLHEQLAVRGQANGGGWRATAVRMQPPLCNASGETATGCRALRND